MSKDKKTKPPKSLATRLAAIQGEPDVQDATRSKNPHPGWEPGVVWEGERGTVTTDPTYEAVADWDELMVSRGLDPLKYEIVGNVRWTSFDGWKRDHPMDAAYSTLCYSYKAEIRLRSKITDTVNLEAVYQDIRKAKKPKKKAPPGDTHFVVALSDWQVGNRDGGGVEEQTRKIANLVDLIPQRIEFLRKAGCNIGHVVLAGMGDLGEGTCGHYPAQQFRIEVDRREQLKLVRRGLSDIIMAVSPIVDKVTVTAVGGNHGENRSAGKAFTTTGDNDDVAVFEQIAEGFQLNKEAFGNVGWRIPLEQLSISMDLAGHIVAFTHGHLSKASQNAAQSIWTWWQKQAMGRAHEGVADANILITGHYHHLNVKEQEGRTLFVCPSLTTVGEYFQDGAGVKTQPGTLTLTVDESGWGNLELLN